MLGSVLYVRIDVSVKFHPSTQLLRSNLLFFVTTLPLYSKLHERCCTTCLQYIFPVFNTIFTCDTNIGVIGVRTIQMNMFLENVKGLWIAKQEMYAVALWGIRHESWRSLTKSIWAVQNVLNVNRWCIVNMLATIVNKIIDKEDYLMLLLTSELHLNQRTKFHEDFYCEFHPLKAGNHLQSKNLYI